MNDDIIGKRSLSTTIGFEAIYAIDKHENVLDVGGIPAELQVITSIGGETVIEPGISVYPNPVRGQLNTLSPAVDIEMVTISDLTGKMVKQTNPNIGQRQLSINMADLEPGMYLVNVSHQQGVVAKKVMVAH